MKCAIIVNPKAGGGKAYRHIRRYLDRWSHPEWEMDLLETAGPNQAGKIALELLENPPDLLAVCGGDGTLNEVATAISAPPFPVAVLPGGTANVVAKELKIPRNTGRALETALNRSVMKVDLGELGPGRRHRFVFVAGIGFDAYVAANVTPAVKSVLGIGAYVLAGLRCLHSYPFHTFQVIADNQRIEATTCIIANARRYGGGLFSVRRRTCRMAFWMYSYSISAIKFR
jgi:diacylglycerol kinase (ATP)